MIGCAASSRSPGRGGCSASSRPCLASRFGPTGVSPRCALVIPGCCRTGLTRCGGWSCLPPALGLRGGRSLSWNPPDGHGLLLLDRRGLFEGLFRPRRTTPGEDGLLEVARLPATLPGAESSSRSSARRPNNAPSRTAASPTTSRAAGGTWADEHRAETQRRSALTGAGHWLNLVPRRHGGGGAGGALTGAAPQKPYRRGVQAVGRRHSAVRVAAYQLQALRDQETAIRGYLRRRSTVLAPYYKRSAPEQQAAQDIRRLGGRPELIGDLDAVEQAAAGWRGARWRRADRRGPGSPDLVNRVTAEAGKAHLTPRERCSTPRTRTRYRPHRGHRPTRPHSVPGATRCSVGIIVVCADRVCGWPSRSVAPSPGCSAHSPPAENHRRQFRRYGSARKAGLATSGHASDVEDMWRRQIVDEPTAPVRARALLDEQAEEPAGSNAGAKQFRPRGLPRPAGAKLRKVASALPAAGEALRPA